MANVTISSSRDSFLKLLCEGVWISRSAAYMGVYGCLILRAGRGVGGASWSEGLEQNCDENSLKPQGVMTTPTGVFRAHKVAVLNICGSGLLLCSMVSLLHFRNPCASCVPVKLESLYSLLWKACDEQNGMRQPVVRRGAWYLPLRLWLFWCNVWLNISSPWLPCDEI